MLHVCANLFDRSYLSAFDEAYLSLLGIPFQAQTIETEPSPDCAWHLESPGPLSEFGSHGFRRTQLESFYTTAGLFFFAASNPSIRSNAICASEGDGDLCLLNSFGSGWAMVSKSLSVIYTV